MPVAAVILAGGLARRMGGIDKPLVELGGKPILAHIVKRLQGQAGSVAINANGQPRRFEAFGLPVIADSVAGHPGPLAGILAAMDWASQQSIQRVLTVPGDTPFLPTDLCEKLTRAARSEDEIAVAASFGSAHPVVALWPVALRSELRAFLTRGESRRVRDFIDRGPNVEVVFAAYPDGLDPFFNVNRPIDLAYAEASLQKQAI